MVENGTEPPLAYVEHRLPNRLRLGIPARRGDAAFFDAMAQRLAALPGLVALRVNRVTGSIVLRGDAASLAAAAEAQGLFRITDAPVPIAPRRAPRAPATRPRIEPLSAAAAGLAGLSLLQAARRRTFGPAVENFWHAYNAGTVLQRPWMAAGLVGVGLVQLARGQALNSAASLAFYALNARRLARGRITPGR